MPKRADKHLVYLTVERLREFLYKYDEELATAAVKRVKPGTGIRKGKGARAEFVRIAMELAEQEGMWSWNSLQSGQQSLYLLLEKNRGASPDTIQLLNATMDYYEGSDGKLTVPESEISEPDYEKHPGFAMTPEEKAKATPVEEGPDQTTYDVAIALVEEYEEVFRKIVFESGINLNIGEWQAVTHKSETALEAVKDLRRKYVEAADNFESATADANSYAHELETLKVKQGVYDSAIPGANGIRASYADALLQMLTEFKADEQGNHMLELIFDRLDKLAGI